MRYHRAKIGKRDIFVKQGWKRLSAWVCCPWVRQSHMPQRNRIAEGDVLSEPGKREYHLPVCKHAVCGAHRRPAIAVWIPGQSYPGEKLTPPVTLHLLTAVVLGVSGEDHPSRCIDVHAAPRIRIEQLLIKMAEPAVLARPWKVRLPSQTIVHRELRRHFPGVLHVSTYNVLAVVKS